MKFFLIIFLLSMFNSQPTSYSDEPVRHYEPDKPMIGETLEIVNEEYKESK